MLFQRNNSEFRGENKQYHIIPYALIFTVILHSLQTTFIELAVYCQANASIHYRLSFYLIYQALHNKTRTRTVSPPETIKEISTFRAKVLRRELVVRGRGKPRVFLYELYKNIT